MFEDAGLEHLHLVDLDGAKAQHIVNQKVLNDIAKQTTLTIDFGGGLKSDKDLEIAFDSGASQITGGSIAIKDKDLFLKWLQKYGSKKIILGADVKGLEIAVSGWQEKSGTNLFDFLKFYVSQGVEYVICTDISKDGALQGAAIELYNDILKKFPEIKLIASGGVSSIAEIDKLAKNGLYGAIIGKAIYENKININELC